MSIKEQVSVVIPTRNRATLLKQLLTALQKQTMPPNEVIIIDDASEDNTAKVAKDFMNRLNLKYLRLERRLGASNARNMGLRATTNELIIICDDDLLPSEHWIKELVNCLLEKGAEKDVAAVRGRFRPLSNKQWLERLVEHYDLGNDIKYLPMHSLIECSLFKRSALISVNYFNPKMIYGSEVLDLALKLDKAGYKRILYTPHALAYHDYAKSLFGYFEKAFIMGFTKTYVEKKSGKNLKVISGKASKLLAIFLLSVLFSPIMLFYSNAVFVILPGLCIPLILVIIEAIKYRSLSCGLVLVIQRLVRLIGVLYGKLYFTIK